MKVSVIVPVYNTEKYLRKCLDSLVNQDFNDYEILVIDDGSPDNSFKIIKEYEKKYDCVHYFKKKNGGLSDARNYGLKYAKGNYIAFVDSDDYVTNDYLKKMYNQAIKDKSDIVVCEFSYVYDNGNIVRSYSNSNYTTKQDKKYLLTPPMACLRLYRKELFNNHQFYEGIYYEDLELTPRLVLDAKKISFVNESLYYYVMRIGSIMKQKTFNSKLYDIYKVLDTNYDALYSKYPTEIEYMYIIHLLRTASLRFLDYEEGKKELNKIVQIIKERFPNWKKNEYFKKDNIKIKLICYLAHYKRIRLLKLIKRITGK